MTTEATERVQEILKQAHDERSVNDIPFLLKAFYRMRLLAINHAYDGLDSRSVDTLVEKEFNELMK